MKGKETWRTEVKKLNSSDDDQSGSEVIVQKVEDEDGGQNNHSKSNKHSNILTLIGLPGAISV